MLRELRGENLRRFLMLHMRKVLLKYLIQLLLECSPQLRIDFDGLGFVERQDGEYESAVAQIVIEPSPLNESSHDRTALTHESANIGSEVRDEVAESNCLIGLLNIKSLFRNAITNVWKLLGEVLGVK